ncbi:cytochrome P450 2U1-like isoform X2 [Styela clava]
MVGSRFSYEGQVGLGKMLSYTSQLSDEYHGDILGILLIAPFLRFLPFIKQSYQKLLAGIAGIDGSSGKIGMKHQDQMPYTRAFIQEILRYQSPVPLGLPHKTTSEITVQGFKIPPNTTILANFWGSQRDPKIVTDPNKFLPERFIDSNGRFVNNDHLLPFGIGSRQCIGEQIARMQLFMFLTNIVQKFQIRACKNKRLPSFNQGVLGIGYSPHDFAVEFHQK